jgi:hypothetical protein
MHQPLELLARQVDRAARLARTMQSCRPAAAACTATCPRRRIPVP